MSNLNGKTPVSCLQEYLLSQKMVPQYELINSKTGTHNPQFTFRVQVGGIWEQGAGRSKQEAKQQAALKMLKGLKVIDDSENENYLEFNKKPPEEDFASENYVGFLKEYCIVHHHPEPAYDLEEMGGPPHNRTFKMVCHVSKLQDFGISKTKQQAKHQAAFKMLKRLKLLEEKSSDKDENSPKSSCKSSSSVLVEASLTEEQIAERFKAVRTSNITEIHDPIAYYKDHHKAYIYLVEISPTLKDIVNKKEIKYKNFLNVIEKIANELGVSLNVTEIPGTEERNIILLALCVMPSVAAAGSDIEEASLKLLESLLILCK